MVAAELSGTPESPLLGLVGLFLLGLGMVLAGQALKRSDAFYARLVAHVEGQRRLGGLPAHRLVWSARERLYVSVIMTWAGVLLFGVFAWLIIMDLVRP
ncbi:MAG TPA: hypothetical protein VLU24_02595 [Mycobacterium sp.]|nr:hypothetical protein [Mycobacterium sp.]